MLLDRAAFMDSPQAISIQAYREFLQESALVPEAFERNRAFDAHESSFRDAVASGIAHQEGLAVTSKADPRVFRGDKGGRPLGSGDCR